MVRVLLLLIFLESFIFSLDNDQKNDLAMKKELLVSLITHEQMSYFGKEIDYKNTFPQYKHFQRFSNQENIKSLLKDKELKKVINDDFKINDVQIPLLHAVTTSCSAPVIIEDFLKIGLSPNIGYKENYPLLLRKDKKVVSILLKYGANIDCVNDNNETLIFLIDDEDILTFCLKNGASVNHLNKDNKTPLYCALGQKNFDKAKVLLRHGASFFINGENIIHRLIKSNYRNDKFIYIPVMIQLALANSDIDINIKDNKGNTFLHKMCCNLYGEYFIDHLDSIKIVLLYGANKDLTNNKGKTPLDIAKTGLKKALYSELEQVFNNYSNPEKNFETLFQEQLAYLIKEKTFFEIEQIDILSNDTLSVIFYWFIYNDIKEEANKIFCISKTYYNALLNLLKNSDLNALPMRQKYALFLKMGGSEQDFFRIPEVDKKE